MSSAPARLAWAALGVAGAVACAHLGSPWLLAAWLAPDLGVLAGGVQVIDARGQLGRRAAQGYNATHALLGPTLLASAAIISSSTLLAALTSLWLSHIGVDRALGYTLKMVPISV